LTKGGYEVELTQLCEELHYIMAFVCDNALADRELGIDKIVHLVCAGEGLL